MRFQNRKTFMEFVELVRSLGYELTPSSRGYANILVKLAIFKLQAYLEVDGRFFTITLINPKNNKNELIVTLEKVSNIWLGK